METLMEWLRSPPVPTRSITPSGSASSTGTARSSMALTRPVSSSAVSPFIRSATMKPAICDGVAFPEDLAHRGRRGAAVGSPPR
ncbi:MAG: hypothetical protein R2711_16455 [Acidimicrobiales bacterium]